MNPYQVHVADLERHLVLSQSFPLGGFPPAPRPALSPDAPTALIFSPHPDDECIIGGLALRLLRESGMRVINIAVTQGSKRERQAERLQELQAACDYLGFGLLQTAPTGLEGINVKARAADPARWRANVQIIAGILAAQQPKVIFFPHEYDWNSTHIGTFHLVTDALKTLPGFECLTVETEYWGAMAAPNLMVESSAADLADLMTGTSFHVGEVRRNPFHLLLPAWMQDNVRRGSEVVGGQGEAAPDFHFATLYRLQRWSGGGFGKLYQSTKQLSKTKNPATLWA